MAPTAAAARAAGSGVGGQPSVFISEVYFRNAISSPISSRVNGRFGMKVLPPPRRSMRSRAAG
ncbi:MAG: hypothetical protein M5U30_09580 [Burkholderiaceae bacterium]|nr:hypothetical protein [Burkholderiaceae bacterium]